MPMKLTCLLAASLLGAVAVPASGAALVTPTAFSPAPSGGAFTMGFAFSVSDQLVITALGAYDNGGDGFTPKEVGLWANDGTLLASTIVPGTNPLVDGFRYNGISPYQLTPGQTYVVGAYQYAGAGETYATAFGPLNPAPGVTFLNARAADGFSFRFPGSAVNTGGYFGANALVAAAPEPATWAMMIAGFGLAGSALRRSRRLRSGSAKVAFA